MSFAYQIVILTLFSLLLDCVEYVHGVLGDISGSIFGRLRVAYSY